MDRHDTGEDVNWIQVSLDMDPVKTMGNSQILQKQEISSSIWTAISILMRKLHC
jgi:hypothetical protein